MWQSYVGLVFSIVALAGVVWLYLESLKKLEKHDIKGLLSESSTELEKQFERKLKAIETEWDDMYQKFSRLAGRMDRRKQQESSSQEENPAPSSIHNMTRNDLLRRRNHV